MDLDGLDEWWLYSSESDTEDDGITLHGSIEPSLDFNDTETHESVNDIFTDSYSEIGDISDSDQGDKQLVEPQNVKEKFGVKRVRIPRAKNSWRTKTVEVADIPCAKVSSHPVLRRGTKCQREVRKLQKTGELLIPKKSFKRSVKSICREIGATQRIGSDALDALQEAFESFAVKLFNLSNQIANNSGRVTVLQKDFVLASKTLVH